MAVAPQQREADIVRHCVDLLVRECAPQRIYLFGSRAKQQAQPNSDFDFAVDGAAPEARKKSQVQALLEAIAGLYSVNVVFLEEADEHFRTIILETGKVLYERP